VELDWCSVCGGQHARRTDCPGELLATGVERHGWRTVVETPFGLEAYGVLVAPTFDIWRARILTYPNVLWTAPGGAVTMKFIGATAPEAEARAIAFVEGHIKARGYARKDAQEPPSVSAYLAEAQARLAAAANPALRKLKALPIRFGNAPTFFNAMTANLSESGLFVITLAPFEEGAGVRVLFNLETGPAGLNARVVWRRERATLGRPVGMGVKLIAPPDPYRNFVAELP
jgi:Tfp pilus assembly protein PilZ